MPAWFNKRPFALATPKLKDWWRRYSPEVFPQQFGSLSSVPWKAWGAEYARQFPKLEPGQFFWPTGASRFGVYCGIADATTVFNWRLETMEQEEGVGRTAKTFMIYDGKHEAVRKLMYMLPARPLTFYRQAKCAYLVTLVDERFFWWYRDCGNLSGSASITSWDALFEFFRTTLEISSSDWECPAVDERYYFPGIRLAEAVNLPLPILMDAAAWSVGRRIVVEFDGAATPGRVHVMTSDVAKYRRDNDLKGMRALAGGLFDMPVPDLELQVGYEAAAILPAKVRVSFPRVDDDSGRVAYDYDTNAQEGFELYKSAGTITIHDEAEVTSEVTGEAEELGQMLAVDYLTYTAEENTEVVLAGIRLVDPCGFYDAIDFIEECEKDDQLEPDPNAPEGWLTLEAKVGYLSCTKISRPPWLWRGFTLFHSFEGYGSEEGSEDDDDGCVRVGDFLVCTEDGAQINEDARICLRNGRLVLEEG